MVGRGIAVSAGQPVSLLCCGGQPTQGHGSSRSAARDGSSLSAARDDLLIVVEMPTSERALATSLLHVRAVL